MTHARLEDPVTLEDGAALQAADTQGLLRAVASAGAQVRAVAAAVAEGELAGLDGVAPRSVVLVSSGGPAGHAVALVQQLVGVGSAVPVVAVSATPRWVGALDVVVALGDDAGDLELAASVARAVGRGADVVLVTPAEGPLAAAGGGRAVLLPPRVRVPDGTGLLRFLAAALAVLGVVGAVPPVALDALADALDVEAARDHPGAEVFASPAKSLAARTVGRRLVIVGAGPLGTVLARHATVALLRHAGVTAVAAELDDALVATRHPGMAGTGGVDPLFRAPLFRDPLFHDPLFHDPELDGPPPQDRVRVLVLAVGSERTRLAQRTAALVDAVLLTGTDTDSDEDAPVTTDLVGAVAELVVLVARVETAAVYAGLTN